jgi:hypothetical protein
MERMNIVKKLLSLLVFTCFVITLGVGVVGCGSPTTAPAPTTTKTTTDTKTTDK